MLSGHYITLGAPKHQEHEGALELFSLGEDQRAIVLSIHQHGFSMCMAASDLTMGNRVAKTLMSSDSGVI